MKKTAFVMIVGFVLIGLVFVVVAYNQNQPDEPEQDMTEHIYPKEYISSTSLLTDETTGKGIISLGDSVDEVMSVLEGYETDEGSTIMEHSESTYGAVFFFGDAQYIFDTGGRLISYKSGIGFGSFETSRGLKIGDSVERMFELYGTDYTFSEGSPARPSAYFYSFGITGMTVVILSDSDTEGDMSGVVYQILVG